MDPLALFQIGLAIFSEVSAAAHKKGLTELASATDRGIAELRKVHGTEVTKAQIESLRA